MARKNNIRSMRFSDEMIEIIEAQVGDTFTAKFEALVTRCMWELPEKERQKEVLEQAIKSRREQLGRMTNKVDSYRKRLYEMDRQLLILEKNIAAAQEHEW